MRKLRRVFANYDICDDWFDCDRWNVCEIWFFSFEFLDSNDEFCIKNWLNEIVLSWKDDFWCCEFELIEFIDESEICMRIERNRWNIKIAKNLKNIWICINAISLYNRLSSRSFSRLIFFFFVARVVWAFLTTTNFLLIDMIIDSQSMIIWNLIDVCFEIRWVIIEKKIQTIERIMDDYHSIALNLVVLVTYMQMGAQEVCECQGTSLNKDALVFFSSGYINWTWLQHICGGCIFNISSQQPLVSPALYSNELSLA